MQVSLVSDGICEKIDFSDESINHLQLVIDDVFLLGLILLDAMELLTIFICWDLLPFIFSLENGETCPVMPSIKGGSTTMVP